MTIRTVTYDDAVHKFVLLEPTEAMMHAAEDVPSPRPYGAVYRAMIAVSPPFTSLPNPNHDLDLFKRHLKESEEALLFDERLKRNV